MFKDLCEVFAPSGDEQEMRDYIIENAKKIFDTVETDNIGNLICRKSGSGRRICVECGLDSCGIMVISKECDKAYFSGVGGVGAAYLNGKKVVFKNSEVGVVRFDGKNIDNAKVTDLYVEVDTQNISIGDFAVIVGGFFENSTKLFANDLSTKIAIAAVLQAVRAVDTNNDLTVLFSAQRRFAAKGIKTFFGCNDFDEVITVDGVTCENGIKADSGCAVIAVDSRGVSDKAFRDSVENLAEKCGAKIQTAVTGENLCLEAIATSGRGENVVALGIPVMHKGKPFECVLKSDLDKTVKLLKTVIEEV